MMQFSVGEIASFFLIYRYLSAEKCSAGAQLCATNVIIHTKAPTNQTFTQIVFFQQVILSRLKPGRIPGRFS
jgi:hypothetical protein